jgi:TPR repeat protein
MNGSEISQVKAHAMQTKGGRKKFVQSALAGLLLAAMGASASATNLAVAAPDGSHSDLERCRVASGFDARGWPLEAPRPDAVSLCERAVKQPRAPAQAFAYLGRSLYMSGQYEQAHTAIRRAQSQGSALGLALLGVLYQYGYGVEANPSVAASWSRKAAEKGNALGQSNLAAALAEGRGVVLDVPQAYAWEKKAAEQGFPTAQARIGDHLLSGRGVAKDEASAALWYDKAAQQGDSYALFKLGLMRRDGQAGPAETTKGEQMIEAAAKLGEPQALRLKRRMARMIPLADQPRTIRDRSLSVVWTASDSSVPLIASQAEQHCRGMGPDWRLPTPWELQTLTYADFPLAQCGLYPGGDRAYCRLQPGVRLTSGLLWVGKIEGERSFRIADMTNGELHSVGSDESWGPIPVHALCLKAVERRSDDLEYQKGDEEEL